MKKLIDCFPYFNEKELLELRIRLLKEYFDEFIITDANRTHTGTPKPFTAKQAIQELGLENEKIRVVEVELPSKEEEPNDHVRERMQRNAAAEYIEWNTVAFVGDADEIMNPAFVKYYETIVRTNPNNILHVPMVYLMGRADLRDYHPDGEPRFWGNCYMCMGHHKEYYTLSQIRESYSEQRNDVVYKDVFAVDNGKIEEAGWHFSWMGNAERLSTKYQSFMHYGDSIEDTEFGTNPTRMIEHINQWKPSNGGTDPLGRYNHILKEYPKDKLPKKIFELPRVESFLLPKNND